MFNLLYALLFATLLRGEITHYAPRVMEATYQARLAMGHVQPCPRCIGMLAVEDRRYVGWHAYLRLPDGRIEGPYLIVDCGPLLTPGRIAELDYRSAVRLGSAGQPLRDVTLFMMAPRS